MVEVLAREARAFVTTGQSDAPLFVPSARMAEQCVGNFKAQNLANTAWAFAKVGPLHAPLFAVSARAMERLLSEFNPPDLAITVWAFAKVGRFDAPLFKASARSVKRRVDEFSAHNLANTAWAFAMAEWSDTPLFAVLMAEAAGALGGFRPEQLFMTLWALLQRGNLTDAWTFCQRAKCTGQSFSPLCLGLLLMECEQRGQLDCEIGVLEGLASDIEMDIGGATKCVVAIRLAKIQDLNSPESGERDGVDYDPGVTACTELVCMQ